MNPISTNNVRLKSVYLGICFLCLFTTYNLSQGYLTTIFQADGYIFIALIYFPYSLMSLISAWVGVRLGLKAVLLVGSFTYVVWTLIITVDSHPLIMFCAIINGLGASLLWVHEGIWISRLIKSDLNSRLAQPAGSISVVSRDGTLTGLFFGIYNFSGILGNIVIMILVKYIDLILILRIMSGFTLLTWSLFWLLPYPSWKEWRICWNRLDLDNSFEDEKLDLDNNFEDEKLDFESALSSLESAESETTPTPHIWDMADFLDGKNAELSSEKEVPIRLARDDSLKNHSRRLGRVWSSDRRILSDKVVTEEKQHSRCQVGKYPFLIPLMVQIALLNLLSYGIISALSGKSIIPGYDGAFVIAGYFLLYSISSAIFSVAWGYLYDWLSWIFLLSVVEILLFTELLFIAINLNYELDVSLNPVLNVYYVWWIIGIIAGIIDTGCNVLLNASISFTFDKEVAPYVFSWYRFIYCMSTAIFSVINYLIAPLYIMYGIMGWSVLMGLSIVWFKVKSK